MCKSSESGKETLEGSGYSCGLEPVKDYLTYQTLCPLGAADEKNLKESLFRQKDALELGKEYQLKGDWEEAVQWYQKSAEDGNAEAMKALGYCCWKGMGTQRNLYRALRWYSKVMETSEEDVSECLEGIYKEIKAERNNKKSEEPSAANQMKVGDSVNQDSFRAEEELQKTIQLYYQTDMRTPENFEMLRKKFLAAASAGIPLAKTMLGLLFWRCYPFDPRYASTAVEYLRMAMEQGCPLGGVWLAEILMEMRRTEPDFMPERTENRSTQLMLLGKLKILAEQENAEAIYWIALEFYRDEEYEEAVRWLEWAAEQHMPQAYGYLGICSYYGRGLSLDYDRAYTYFRKAEHCGEAWIYRYLGECLYYGHGMENDTDKAAQYYEAAAAQYDIPAILRSGQILIIHGKREEDFIKGFQYLLKASEYEESKGKALDLLGFCRMHGLGTGKNETEAARYFRESAELGDPDGCFHLSECYQNGVGVQKSSYEEKIWLEKAADAGNAEAAFRMAKYLQKTYKAMESMRIRIEGYAEVAYREGIHEAALILARNFWYRADYPAKGISQEQKQMFYKQAESYFAVAEEKGVQDARTEKAYFYLKRSENKKSEEGIRILQEEINRNNLLAKYYLGLCYTEGDGIKKNKRMGTLYIRQALSAGLKADETL